MEKIGEKEEQEDLWQRFCGSGGRWCAEVEVLGSLSSSRCWESLNWGVEEGSAVVCCNNVEIV